MTVEFVILSDAPDQEKSIIIKDKSYNFRFRWNTKESAWYVQIGRTGSDYLCKTKLVVGCDILRPYRHIPDLESCGLFVFDQEQRYGRIGRNNLGYGKRFVVVVSDLT